jgi:hypothetical protein
MGYDSLLSAIRKRQAGFEVFVVVGGDSGAVKIEK